MTTMTGTCTYCRVIGGQHEDWCVYQGGRLPVLQPAARAPSQIPHDLIRVVRHTLQGFGPDRAGAATDGEGVVALLTCAVIQALRVGIDPRTLADAFSVIVRYTSEELGKEDAR